VNEEFVEPTITATNKGTQTGGGAVGNGKFFVLDLLDCIRISIGEPGGKAIG
jgi:nitrogen regulatory protein P-II 1